MCSKGERFHLKWRAETTTAERKTRETQNRAFVCVLDVLCARALPAIAVVPQILDDVPKCGFPPGQK